MDADSKTDTNANPGYRDSIFTRLFGTKEKIRELLGAIDKTTYGPETEIEITTIDNILSRGIKNDISFEVDDKFVVLIEHQSTLSENMPLRMLQYIVKLFNRRITKRDVYRKKRIRLPFPEFIILYNGTDEMPEDLRILRLSDSFTGGPRDGEPPLELTVKMYNINKGRNVEMAKRSPTLDAYETFIAMVRENEKTMKFKDAVAKAVEDCINQNILKDFMSIHRKELVDMLVTEWDYDLEKEVLREEAWEEGAGEERKKNARAMRAKGMDVDTVAEITGLTIDDILRL